MSYEIITDRLPGEQIIVHQVNLIRPDPEDPTKTIRQTLICQMLNCGDEQVKRKLVELGWTPPGSTAPEALRDAAKAVVEARATAGGIGHQLHNAIVFLATRI